VALRSFLGDERDNEVLVARLRDEPLALPVARVTEDLSHVQTVGRATAGVRSTGT
jgi:hypothetical protein